MSGFFLWPEPRYLRDGFRGLNLRNSSYVESLLADLFPGGVPVLVSSGRAALALIAQHLGLARHHRVSLPPYASHCVIEAIARYASPVCFGDPTTADVAVIYHQWGFINKGPFGGTLIEDAADALCMASAELFPRKGRYEIWSLPKSTGSLSGAVIWCRDPADASGLRVLRDSGAKRPLAQWLLRCLGQRFSMAERYWAGVESGAASLPRLAIGDIAARILAWDRLISDRLKKMEVLRPFVPDWLQIPSDRIPCAVPVVASEKEATAIAGLGIRTGWRHFERTSSEGSSLVRVLPLPIHIDVPIRTVRAVAHLLAAREGTSR